MGSGFSFHHTVGTSQLSNALLQQADLLLLTAHLQLSYPVSEHLRLVSPYTIKNIEGPEKPAFNYFKTETKAI